MPGRRAPALLPLLQSASRRFQHIEQKSMAAKERKLNTRHNVAMGK
jgi:hypothetical protein